MFSFKISFIAELLSFFNSEPWYRDPKRRKCVQACPVPLDIEHQIYRGKQIFLFPGIFSVCNHYQKPNKPNFATIFNVLLLCIKCSFGLLGARKQMEQQCFLWKCEAVVGSGRGVCLGGWAALGLPGSAPGFLLALLCPAAGIPELVPLACGTHHSVSWQLSMLARHGWLWRDAVLKGWNMGVVECEEKSIVYCSNQNFMFQMQMFRPKCSVYGQLLLSQVFHELYAMNMMLVSKSGERKPLLILANF